MIDHDYQTEVLQRLTRIETQNEERWAEIHALIKVDCPAHRRRTSTLERKMWVVWGCAGLIVLILLDLARGWLKEIL